MQDTKVAASLHIAHVVVSDILLAVEAEPLAIGKVSNDAATALSRAPPAVIRSFVDLLQVDRSFSQFAHSSTQDEAVTRVCRRSKRRSCACIIIERCIVCTAPDLRIRHTRRVDPCIDWAYVK
ncbi:hypothetical protein D3C85_1612260 [compost metagenome]